nr:hypothetical protein [Tanacetum cinerariifolium]
MGALDLVEALKFKVEVMGALDLGEVEGVGALDLVEEALDLVKVEESYLVGALDVVGLSLNILISALTEMLILGLESLNKTSF